MINSINTNIASYFAQANIGAASSAAASSVARLSSGNRIVQASDDVTALAIGTALGTQISALRTAQTNAAQGNSLLQVADGAVAQIQAILQQQQSIANQAQSGSLTDTNRGFLNTQFQKLSAQIDAIANGTTFNGVSLIDGSLATGGGASSKLRSYGMGAGTAAATVRGFTAGTDVLGFTSLKNTANADNDTSFVGDLSKGTFGVVANPAGDGYVISYTINGTTYSGNWVTNTDTSVSLVSTDGKYTIVLDMLDSNSTLTNFNAADSILLQTQLETAFGSATSYAIHKIATSFATNDTDNSEILGSAIRSKETAGTILDGFSGSNVTFQSALFSGKNLPALSNFTASGNGVAGNVSFSVLVNGVKYSTATDYTITNSGGASTYTLKTIQVGKAQTTAGYTPAAGTNGHLIFFKNGDSLGNSTHLAGNEYLDLDLSSIQTSAKYDTDHNVAEIVAALNKAFGGGSGTTGSGGLTFQLGSTSDSIINIALNSAQSSALFNGASLDVSTQGGASTATTALQTALDSATSLRSTIGAFQSQFNFAAANLDSSVQNLVAARSGLVDTDIASESTNYATNQVKLQAGISVLAQANQQLQALLKLIG